MNTVNSSNRFLNRACNSNKYSNYTLFTRRETENSSQIKQKNISNINSSIQRPFSSTIKNISMRNLSKNSSSNNKVFKLFSENQSAIISKKLSKSKKNRRIHIEDYFHKKNKCKTNKANIMKSILNLEKYYTPNTSFNKNANIIPNYNINKNTYFNDLQYINDIYLTDVNLKKPIPKNSISINLDNFNFDDYGDNIYIDLSKKTNADILPKFMKDKSNYNYNEIVKTEYNERIINKKRRKINLCREKKNDFMAKIRSEKFDKLSLNSKKELCVRIQEIYKNKLEYLDDRIESFETWKKLNHDFFENKIGDYLKFLMYKKEYEKNKVENLLEEIIKIKKESNKIYSKIAKIELEKNKILRWVYFQIQLKEKRSVLPKYYKLILENINLIDKYYEIQYKKEKNSEIIQNNNYILSAKTPSPRKRDKKKKEIKKINSEKENSNLILNSELVAFLNKKEGKSEYLRIKEYKNNLIFKNAEEFHEGLLSIEKEDLRLIEYNDFLKEKIFWLKKELDKVIKEKNKNNNIFNSNLRTNLNELHHLKQRHSTLESTFKYLEKNKNINKYNNRSNNKIKNKKRNKSANITYKKAEVKKADKKLLYLKINKIFNLCKLVKFKNQKDYEILDEKRKLLKNDEILYYFVYIEYSVNYLLTEMNKYLNNHKDGEKGLKKIIFDIERSHRIKKAEEMKKHLREKYIKLEYEINKKNNKIYFLPYKKVKDVRKIKKEKIIIEDKGNKQPDFEDFIDDDNANNNFSYQNSV